MPPPLSHPTPLGPPGLYTLSAKEQSRLATQCARGPWTVRSAHLQPGGKPQTQLRQLGRDLHLPAYYGGNLDALYDCLTDTSWRGTQPLLVLISGIEEGLQQNSTAIQPLLEVLTDVVGHWNEANFAGWLVLDTDLPTK